MADLIQKQWHDQLKSDLNAVVIDVRTQMEMEEGYIPRAINVDIYNGQEFIESIMKLDKNKSYYVYCKSGGRSAQACAYMQQTGFEKVYNLLGGFHDWQGEISNN